MARKEKTEEQSKGGGIVVMMTALMILLLAFFIVLFSMSSIEEEKKEQALQSIYRTFGALPAGKTPYFSIGAFNPETSAPMTPLDEDFQEIKDLAYVTLGEDKIRLLTDGGRRVVVINREILFDADGTTIKSEAKPFLTGLAAIISKSPYWVDVAGHTDDIPPAPGGPAANNWALSGMRAIAVVEFLLERDVADDRLAAFGYGPLGPLRPNNSVKNREINNRVEIILDESTREDVVELESMMPRKGSFRYKGFIFDLLKNE